MNELSDIVRFLNDCPPFDQLPAEVQAGVAGSIEISYHREGTQVLAVNAENAELHVIRKGAVLLEDADGRLIAKRGERGLFGYPSMLTGQPARLGARVAEDTLLYHIPGEHFHQLRRDHPAFDRYFSAALSERVRDARKPTSGAGSVMSATVASLMASPPITIVETASVSAAARTMADARASSVMVVAESDPGQVTGVFTDRDLRNRIVAAGESLDAPIRDFMTPDPITIDGQASAVDALIVMNDDGVHHLPVLAQGALVGVITLTDLFCALNNHPVYLAARIRRQPDLAGVVAASKERFQLLAQLIERGMQAQAIARMITAITDAATVRLIELANEELGAAPLPYAWVCFGSQARREQTGRTDQDNGLIFGETPSDEHAAYFAALADRVCAGLNDCGFVFCPGDIMASNPKWRMALRGWQDCFRRWIDEPEPKRLMYASIFFDIRCIAGERGLVDELTRFVYERAGENTIFLRHMAGNALQHRPPLGFFRQFVVEHDGEHGEEGLNLKQRGVVPVISLARIRALELGLATPETLHRLTQGPGSDHDDLTSLTDALDVISQVRLSHQLSQWEEGQTLSNWVKPEEISSLARRNLKAAFTVVANAQAALARRYRLE
ncbi:MAG: DUF294 nucleotidyltransferase-like domain-containing protein [Pseudomonadota bacterium]